MIALPAFLLVLLVLGQLASCSEDLFVLTSDDEMYMQDELDSESPNKFAIDTPCRHPNREDDDSMTVAFQEHDFATPPSSAADESPDYLRPDLTRFRSTPITIAELDLSPTTVASIATTPTSSPDTTPDCSPNTICELPRLSPSPITSMFSRARKVRRPPKVVTNLVKPEKTKGSVAFSDRENVLDISPAPLIEGEDSNFWQKKSREERRLSLEEGMEEDEAHWEHAGKKRVFDWDAFLDVDELYREYKASRPSKDYEVDDDDQT